MSPQAGPSDLVPCRPRADRLTLYRVAPGADRLNATVPLQLSTSLAGEAGLAPWSVTHRHLNTWLQLVYDQVTHAPLEDFIRRLIRPHYLELGWRDEGSHVVRSADTTVPVSVNFTEQ